MRPMQCAKCFKFERNLENHLPTHDDDGPRTGPSDEVGGLEEGEIKPPAASPTAATPVSAARASTPHDNASALLSLAAFSGPA